MASEKDYSNLYGQAYAAYGQGSYDEAASYIDEMVASFPQDPNVLLLKGHICVGLEEYGVAQQTYEQVLQVSDRQDLIDCAQAAIAQIQEVTGNPSPKSFDTMGAANELDESIQWEDSELDDDWEAGIEDLDWNSAVFTDDDFGEPTLGNQGASPGNNPFLGSAEVAKAAAEPDAPATNFTVNPFDAQPNDGKIDWDAASTINWDSEVFRQEVAESRPSPGTPSSDLAKDEGTAFGNKAGEKPFSFTDTSKGESAFLDSPERPEDIPTFQAWMDEDDTTEDELDSLLEHENVPTVQSSPMPGTASFGNGVDAFEDNNFDDLADFDLTDIAPELPDSSLFTQTGFGPDTGSEINSESGELESPATIAGSPPPGMVTWLKPEDGPDKDFSGASSRFVKPTVEVDPGWWGWFTNAPLRRKQIYLAIAAGLSSGLAVVVINGAFAIGRPNPASQVSPPKPTATQQTPRAGAKPNTPPKSAPAKNSESPLLLIAVLTSLATGIATFLVSNLLVQQVKQTIDDLQNQFDAIYEGNFNVRAKVRSEDELGQLSQRFNYISQVILTATSEAQERATATEKAREKLQRQVIRLLDDVEGASRGDLTVQAEVTADELGAVADAFNLTIQNLREIVLQVKNAAKQVNRNCTDSESFARNNSSDALRMAEELAVTLNSVQLMTESIQRVAENAREAEEVAHSSSLTALKGGEAVERTVGGILQIRETVSETARKVKRLAEASQEISKIVAVISQIASRTNLLALNASIQAARAGEAGRGFAIVADEVRQLADRSAKSLKDIEQIVLQIQSETGSVMTAMEEGIQQVIDVTDKSEQSKRALEDIIEVSNRINSLVRSITADTVRQQENSSSVAQVMQSIELTAQETSQESQRVAGSLQTLVSISRDLLTSVERFRLEQSLK